MLKELILILMTGVLVNNYVLQQFLGVCPFLGVSKKIGPASAMGIAVTFVMLCATAVTYPLYTFVLVPQKLEYFQTIVFILVIASLVQFVEIVLKRFIPALHKSLGVYLPLLTTNCAVLGVTINNVSAKYSILETMEPAKSAGFGFLFAMISSLGVGIGFLLAMVLFAGVRSRIENCPAPKAFKGLPVTLISASIVALAFYGFAGVVENLLNM